MLDENDNIRIRKYFAPMYFPSPSNLYSINKHLIKKDTIDYIDSLIKKYNLSYQHKKDLLFFASHYVAKTTMLNDNIFKMNQQHLRDIKIFMNIFKDAGEDYLDQIESISIKIKDSERPIRFDRMTNDYRIMDKITYKLYLLFKELSKDPTIDQPKSLVSRNKKYITEYFWLYKYLNTELKTQKIDTCRIIAKFIELFEYSLNSLEQNPEDYIYNIMKNIKM